MADTYTQFYMHLVFTPKKRDALIQRSWKNDLEKYITGIVQHYITVLCTLRLRGSSASYKYFGALPLLWFIYQLNFA